MIQGIAGKGTLSAGLKLSGSFLCCNRPLSGWLDKMAYGSQNESLTFLARGKLVRNRNLEMVSLVF